MGRVTPLVSRHIPYWLCNHARHLQAHPCGTIAESVGKRGPRQLEAVAPFRFND